jgi:hypothetical protein
MRITQVLTLFSECDRRRFVRHVHWIRSRLSFDNDRCYSVLFILRTLWARICALLLWTALDLFAAESKHKHNE